MPGATISSLFRLLTVLIISCNFFFSAADVFDFAVDFVKNLVETNQEIKTIEDIKKYVEGGGINEHVIRQVGTIDTSGGGIDAFVNTVVALYTPGKLFQVLKAQFEDYDLNNIGNAKDIAEAEKKKLQEIISTVSNLNKEEIVAPGTDASCGEKFFQISYIKLGDLVDVALDTLFQGDDRFANKGFAEKRVKLLLGTFTYNDYGEEPNGGRAGNRVVKDDDDNIVKLLTGKEKTMNLADVPISLETFSRWFNKSVVAPGKETYLISNFIRDVITDLIPMSLGQECYEYAPKQKVRFTMLPMTINSPNGNFFKDVGTTRANLYNIIIPTKPKLSYF